MSDNATLSGRTIAVKQLTMRQVRDVVAKLKAQGATEEPHIIDALFNDDVPAVAIAEATGLSLVELEGEFSQQEVKDLIEKVRAANPFFVGMMERILSSGIRSVPSSMASVS